MPIPLPTSPRIGLVGFGLDTYWPQFAGLRDRLEGYQRQIAERMRVGLAQVIDFGLVDNVTVARGAASAMARAELDLVFVYVSTYALSSTILTAVQRESAPIVVVSLQPLAQMDYEAFNRLGDRGVMTGNWLEFCQSCSVPEIACAFERSGIPFHLVSGFLDDEEAWTEIRDWMEAARVAAGMRRNRVGVLGHYYSGMLDVYSDMTQLSGIFGSHFELLEMCELTEHHQSVGPGKSRGSWRSLDVSSKSPGIARPAN